MAAPLLSLPVSTWLVLWVCLSSVTSQDTVTGRRATPTQDDGLPDPSLTPPADTLLTDKVPFTGLEGQDRDVRFWKTVCSPTCADPHAVIPTCTEPRRGRVRGGRAQAASLPVSWTRCCLWTQPCPWKRACVGVLTRRTSGCDRRGVGQEGGWWHGVTKVALIPQDWGPCKKRSWGHRHITSRGTPV